MNIVLTAPRNVVDPEGVPTGHVIIEALQEDPYTRQPQAVGRVRFRGVRSGDIEVVYLCVDHHHRRRGLGSRLLDETADCCTLEGYHRLWIEVGAPGLSEASVVRFLKQNQFHFSGCQTGYPLVMVRELRADQRPSLCLEGDLEAADDCDELELEAAAAELLAAEQDLEAAAASLEHEVQDTAPAGAGKRRSPRRSSRRRPGQDSGTAGSSAEG